MGLRPPDRRDSVLSGGDDELGEWVTVISKFHFVDLAGSERVRVPLTVTSQELTFLVIITAQAHCSGGRTY